MFIVFQNSTSHDFSSDMLYRTAVNCILSLAHFRVRQATGSMFFGEIYPLLQGNVCSSRADGKLQKFSKWSKNGGCNTLKSYFSFLFRISFAVYMRKYFFFISEAFLVSNFCLLIIFKFQGCNKENIFIENFRVSSTKTIFP